MNYLLKIVSNKYFLSFLIFLVWIVFFDQNNWISQWQYKAELDKLTKEKEYYKKQIAKTKKELEELTTNPKSLEKFAREKYLMKKDNEDIFLFVISQKDTIK